jgi:5-(carboxyamino)imidazole ribonucleotide mutase
MINMLKKYKPVVSIVIGSDSDLPVVQDAIKTFEDFDVAHEVLILSAHRTPKKTSKFAKSAQKRGIKVIIAGAGGAAHLAGVIASYYTNPVIGIPIKSKILNGLDSLYSIVQMPPGVPVATVGINAAKNAALLAIQILAVSDKRLKTKLQKYKKNLSKQVSDKNSKLIRVSYKKYLSSI